MTPRSEQERDTYLEVRYRDVEYPPGRIGPKWEWSIFCHPDCAPIVVNDRNEAFAIIWAALLAQGIEFKEAKHVAGEMAYTVQQDWLGIALVGIGLERTSGFLTFDGMVALMDRPVQKPRIRMRVITQEDADRGFEGIV